MNLVIVLLRNAQVIVLMLMLCTLKCKASGHTAHDADYAGRILLATPRDVAVLPRDQFSLLRGIGML